MVGYPSYRSLPRWITWLAVAVILFAALAPAVSHWVRVSQGSQPSLFQSAEVCSVQVAVGASKQPSSEPQGEHAWAHCPFCLIHADALVPPTGLALIPALALADSLVPMLFWHAPRTLFAWAPSQARAPPTSI
ncbi:MAG: DUF2946 domain-containing protein [Aquabacterium sp.]|nr:DUF2946 domain-containing protein [Aquabacterium sp.]